MRAPLGRVVRFSDSMRPHQTVASGLGFDERTALPLGLRKRTLQLPS